MHLITPFDFLDLFPTERSVVFVGNAPSLERSGLGSWIDSFEVVIRFNEAAIDGHDVDVGRRTDIYVTNPYVEGRSRRLLDETGCRLVLVIAPQTRRGDKQAFASFVGDRPVLFTYTPDPQSAFQAGGLTTGVSAFALLRKTLKPSHVALTGFTMFLGETAHSYWSGQTPDGVAKHDMAANARLLISLINRTKCAVTVTEEVAWMGRQIDCSLHSRVQVRSLSDPRWRL